MIKTIAPIRQQDRHGSGAFKAPRGTRKHLGVDFACQANSLVLSVAGGEVTKLGWVYNANNPNHADKTHFRYVQVTDSNGIDLRFFYVDPSVKKGDKVGEDAVLGKAQDLETVYPGITPHVHFEVNHEGAYINPLYYLKGIKQ